MRVDRIHVLANYFVHPLPCYVLCVGMALRCAACWLSAILSRAWGMGKRYILLSFLSCLVFLVWLCLVFVLFCTVSIIYLLTFTLLSLATPRPVNMHIGLVNSLAGWIWWLLACLGCSSLLFFKKISLKKLWFSIQTDIQTYRHTDIHTYTHTYIHTSSTLCPVMFSVSVWPCGAPPADFPRYFRALGAWGGGTFFFLPFLL